jgi:hypothetical protein
VHREATRRIDFFSLDAHIIIDRIVVLTYYQSSRITTHNIRMAEEQDPFGAGEEEEEGLIMAPMLVAKLQVSFVSQSIFMHELTSRKQEYQHPIPIN